VTHNYHKPPHFLLLVSVTFLVFITGGDRDFRFNILDDHSKFQPMDGKSPLKMVVKFGTGAVSGVSLRMTIYP